jgi:hypothetical protein
MDSTQHVTESRILISTPYGPHGAYYSAMHDSSDIKKIQIHWSDNPSRIHGSYMVFINKDNSRHVELVDKPYWVKKAQENGLPETTEADLLKLQAKITSETDNNPFAYRFMLTGDYVKHAKLRSVWYDKQCRRPGASPKGIAQELDLDYGGSASRFYDINMLERIERECNPPNQCGELIHPVQVDAAIDLEKPKLRKVDHGRVRLWFLPDIYGCPPKNRNYVIGCDVAAGTGGVMSSNSALCVIDRDIGRQVAEFASPDIMPADFAELAVAMCHWFVGRSGPAILIWEANGPPGGQVGKRSVQMGYNNIYFRYQNQSETYNEKEARKIGFWSNSKTKAPLLNSAETVKEAKFYMNLPGGKINHIAADTEEDPSGAGERHGDRVIAAALAWWVCRDYVKSSESGDALASEAAPNTVLGRRLKMEKENAKDSKWAPRSVRRQSHTRGRRRLKI